MKVYVVFKESCHCGEWVKDILGVCSTEEKALQLLKETPCRLDDTIDWEEYEVDAITSQTLPSSAD